VFQSKGVLLIKDRFPEGIPTDFFVITPPYFPGWTASVLFDIAYFAFAIVFVSAVESVLCSTMADRLADNRKTKFNAEKELWGQGSGAGDHSDRQWVSRAQVRLLEQRPVSRRER
jgi:sulfate permease, SulP family